MRVVVDGGRGRRVARRRRPGQGGEAGSSKSDSRVSHEISNAGPRGAKVGPPSRRVTGLRLCAQVDGRRQLAGGQSAPLGRQDFGVHRQKVQRAAGLAFGRGVGRRRVAALERQLAAVEVAERSAVPGDQFLLRRLTVGAGRSRRPATRTNDGLRHRNFATQRKREMSPFIVSWFYR